MLKSLLSNLKTWLFRKIIKTFHLIHRLFNLSDYFVIDRIIKKYRNSGGLRSEYQAYKLFCLQKLLDQYKPVSILELGSGASTKIFIDFIRANGGNMYSIDESIFWLNNSKTLAGITDADNFEMAIKPSKKSTQNNITSISYEIELDRYFDLVFLDGPSFKSHNLKSDNAINGDLFSLLNQNPPRIIIVDGRFFTVTHLEKNLKGVYQFIGSDLYEKGIPLKINYNYFSIFVRL
jgi:hypothetical protein